MKLFALGAVLLSSLSFAHSPQLEPNIFFILNEYQNGSVLEATQFLTNFINDPLTEPEDRVHYLFMRIGFWQHAGLLDLESLDIAMMKELLKNESCREEYLKYYPVSLQYGPFLNH